MSVFKWSHAGIFAAGMLFATKGIELIKSKEAHKVFVETTAFGLRCKDEVMQNVTAVREGCDDIYAEAVQLNEDRANAPEVEVEVVEDKSAAAKPAKRASGKKADK